MIKKSKRIYLDYSLERLLEDEELYKNKESEGYYSKNLKIINEIKSEKNKDIMEKNGYNKILKMKYKELFEEYLKSDEFKKKIEQLNSILLEFIYKKIFMNLFQNVKKLMISALIC